MGERQKMTFEEQDGEGRVVEGRNRDEGKNAKEQKRKEVDYRGTEEMMRGRKEMENKGQGRKKGGRGRRWP
jgi:hypothetical protein